MIRPAPVDKDAQRKLPIVAVVGRPNVGKSTLFNRLVGERKAIVHDLPGVTRDRNYGAAEWAGRKFLLVDTGGLDSEVEEGLAERVQEQSHGAIAEADVVLFLLDGKSGLNPIDQEAIEQLRKTGKPVLFAVNKLDTLRKQESLYEFYSLGLDRLFPLSAEHGVGLSELMDEIIALFPEEPEGDDGADEIEALETPPCIAIVGRPNVGKSTLTNRLLGFERSVVDATPGTTRDALDTPFELNGLPCILVDTAGMRRKARIDNRVERFSVQRALRIVDRGDLIIHVIDAAEGVTDQDAQILAYAFQRGKALLLAVNKWDLPAKDDKDVEAYREEVYYNLSFLEHVPVAFISAATGFGVRKLLEISARLLKAYQRKIQTSTLNQALQTIVKAHPAPLNQGRQVKFYYGTQTGTRPPTFTLFVNSPAAVGESYKRYLVHQLRESLGLDHAPIKLFLRARREERKRKLR
ncbi:MAG: ribosome biogenesis GTPase Der [Deltaproteobacteria bacterium]|nr:ribosome biogenesis GTPase Der [Deltaproteobacteria bacterium]